MGGFFLLAESFLKLMKKAKRIRFLNRQNMLEYRRTKEEIS
ncbi:hypothetical protein D932_00132 [Enterococcus casseliflavus 14-MB-W-14]|nr:hypothetical protein D932_00132 [Enterococcus casseliflavus 14-MB-W-14]